MQSNTSPSLIVGVGASAGGLEAIEKMFKAMPVGTGMSFIIIQHLSPNFKSMMNELLSRWTDIPVRMVEDGMKVERDTIYLIPRKKVMIISQGHLLLTDKDPMEALTLPIDHFFRSLGQEVGSRSAAVVLSGTGSDGSRGIIDIHESGGLVIAQREETAKFNGMPLAAIETGVCDILLSPEAVPETLVKYLKDPNAEIAGQAIPNVLADVNGLEKVFSLLSEHYDTDFSSYKLNTIIRRTERRMIANRISHINDFANFLSSKPKELEQLYSDLLIGVTRFFRDHESFEELANTAVAEIVENASSDSEIRIWVAGCSTGEEAYTVAILFNERIKQTGKRVAVKIFATDIDKKALEKASQGFYSADSVVEMKPEWLQTYFKQGSFGYQVSPELRSMIVFAPHNILKDAPFTKLDLITCRNLLIYFQSPAQKKVLSLFHFALKTQSFLMTGGSETPGELSDEFSTISARSKIYRKRRDVLLPEEVRLHLTQPIRSLRPSGLPSLRGDSEFSSVPNLVSTYDSLLKHFMPSSVLVDEDAQILHTFAGAGRFLTNHEGRFSSNLMDCVAGELRIVIANAIRKAAADRTVVSHLNLPINLDSDNHITCNVVVTPIQDSNHRAPRFLIQIDEIAEKEHGHSGIIEQTGISELSSEHLGFLEAELQHTKQSLQATIEELETSNEELQATNEELVASNEELQSTNEELHSVNEELYSVNSEFQNKINELSELTKDMDNLLQSTEVHTIFLDNELRIRKFTPNVAEKFNFLPQDIGRCIDAFTHNIACDDITGKLQSVIDTGEISEYEVQDREGLWFLMRILPYREGKSEESVSAGKSMGALLTLVDVTKLREAASALEEAVQHRDEFLAMLSHELRNPLAAVFNATRAIASRDLRIRDTAVEVVQRQTKQMALLLDDLLDVTRVSKGKIRLNKTKFDLREITTPAIESIQPMLDARNQKLGQLVCGEELYVDGSHARLVQVLVNLLANASKYSPTGKKIVLEVKRSDDCALVRIADKGVGIKPELLGKIFDMFRQSNRNLDRSDGGLGVGLTLARSLVELHGGQIFAQSKGEGKGSEFTFEIPLTSIADGELPEKEMQTAIESGDPASGDGSYRRVALVEDNVDAAKMLEFLLTSSGYDVEICHDGVSGLELLKSSKPDVAIIDIGLPLMNGYDLAKKVRAEPSLSDIYLIALTGYGQTSDRQNALEVGFNEHLVKPVDPDKLCELLDLKK